ncbi:Metallophos domain-containing protein [Psidium guajava]|nr:Metallophos domain-containing protein [Psidium guajava]
MRGTTGSRAKEEDNVRACGSEWRREKEWVSAKRLVDGAPVNGEGCEVMKAQQERGLGGGGAMSSCLVTIEEGGRLRLMERRGDNAMRGTEGNELTARLRWLARERRWLIDSQRRRRKRKKQQLGAFSREERTNERGKNGKNEGKKKAREGKVGLTCTWGKGGE